MRTVAALYIDPRGPYPLLEGVECWGMPERDAREYDGPHPVVAHPPCAPWTPMRKHSGNALLRQADCGLHALEAVREFGGVLEHPEGSRLFTDDDQWGYVVHLRQCDWGHPAAKPTKLYVVRIKRRLVERQLAARAGTGKPTHWCSGGRNNKTGGSVPPGIKVCSAVQRRRTPLAFAEFLVSLARQVQL